MALSFSRYLQIIIIGIFENPWPDILPKLWIFEPREFADIFPLS
jgi:hypothetical protein